MDFPDQISIPQIAVSFPEITVFMPSVQMCCVYLRRSLDSNCECGQTVMVPSWTYFVLWSEPLIDFICYFPVQKNFPCGSAITADGLAEDEHIRDAFGDMFAQRQFYINRYHVGRPFRTERIRESAASRIRAGIEYRTVRGQHNQSIGILFEFGNCRSRWEWCAVDGRRITGYSRTGGCWQRGHNRHLKCHDKRSSSFFSYRHSTGIAMVVYQTRWEDRRPNAWRWRQCHVGGLLHRFCGQTGPKAGLWLRIGAHEKWNVWWSSAASE